MPFSIDSVDSVLKPIERAHGSPWWFFLAASQRWVKGHVSCALCGKLWPDSLAGEMNWDRIEPGGPYTLRNGQLVCPSCNSIKNNRPNMEAVVIIARFKHLTRWERRGIHREGRPPLARGPSPFISSRALGKRWQQHPPDADAAMEQAGYQKVPFGRKSWRWRMADVLEAENGKPRPSILRQMVEEVRGR